MAKIIFEGDMDLEREHTNDLFPEGYQIVKIIEANPEISSKGNHVIVTVIECVRTGARNKFWLPVEAGKRWLTRSLLVSLDLYKKNAQGLYEVDSDDLIGKEVGAFIFNVNETYTTPDYKEATKKRSRIKRFMTKAEVIEATKNLSAIKNETNDEEIPF